jgi:hypothetical protein
MESVVMATLRDVQLSLTLFSVGFDDTGHQFILTVTTELIANHPFIFGQLRFEIESIFEVELRLYSQRNKPSDR